MNALPSVALLIILAIPAFAWADVTTRPAAVHTDAELIDRLVELTDQEFSVRTNIIGLGRGAKMPQGTRMMQDPDPFPSPVMSELARRGVEGLPDLARHLDDARKTHVTIKAMASGIWYSAEYDWNPRTSKVRPKGTVDLAARGARAHNRANIVGETDDREYVVCVGDICFNIIGQIVNRRFAAVRYQPTAIIIVNSPVLCPDLRESVRNEWGQLTREQLRESLVGDVTMPASRTQVTGALEVLASKYPDSIVDVARKRLNTPVFDEAKVRMFALKVLYVEPDAARRRKLIDEFIARNGLGYRDGLLLKLWQDRNHQPGDKMVGGPGTDSIPRPTIAPAEVLKQVAPDFDPEHPPIVAAVEGRDTSGFIDAIGKIGRPEFDELIFEQYRAHSQSKSPAWESDTDGIAMACIRQLQHRNHDYQFLAYLRRRLVEMPDPWPEDQGPDAHRSFQSFIDALAAPER